MLGLFEKKEDAAAVMDANIPISRARFAVVDTELTGLDEKKDSIVSIGAVRMAGGRIELGDTLYQLVSPKAALSADSVVIHEITPSDLEGKPRIDSALSAFLDYCGSDVLVGHFISIDLAFLNREMKRLHGREMSNPVLDTFSIYEWLRSRNRSRDCFVTPLSGYRLYDLSKCFGIPINSMHNAVMDAYATAQLLQRFFPLLEEAGVHDIGDLLSIGKPFEGGDRFRLTGEFGNF
jgi:DNA polymerase-3 subunit epsilon